ncbi:hypothetical protein K457DRAFT_1782715 [Linnemannia elongata AG-77]|uniref:Uncharacterized protein n=1 Tax=Linnemannia elongata AG-77 TaxID=1314771 RepID=A0A197JB99_9FUNG|nr:hypothetical protein K457DRAFT_1782715 [Linnemannia elongata AG-77]
MNGSSRTKFNYYCNNISSWVNNPTLTEFCFSMIGRADIEGSKSNVAMNAWLPQASHYNFATNMFHSDHKKMYASIDYIDTNPNDAVHFTPEYINTLDDNSLPQHIITLKVGPPLLKRQRHYTNYINTFTFSSPICFRSHHQQNARADNNRKRCVSAPTVCSHGQLYVAPSTPTT